MDILVLARFDKVENLDGCLFKKGVRFLVQQLYSPTGSWINKNGVHENVQFLFCSIMLST